MAEPSQYEKDTRMLVDKMETRLNGNLERIWDTLDKIKDNVQKRLPTWVSMFHGFLFLIIGTLIGYIAKK